MVELKVIIITNYGFFPAELSNFQLLKSLPYLKRIRLEKVSIPSLCNAPIPLRSVKKISLFMCNIGQAFGNSTIQVSDSLPSLMEINIDHCNDLIGELHNLEELHMKKCLKLHKHLPPSTVDLKQLRLVVCDEERAKLWEPIKESFSGLNVMVAKEDINLNWLQK
uniref:Disease resistance protein n=1 Tax=Quercus lobata TaxID=97700 RepID=A0A7N2KPI2_QUELO